MCLIKINHQLHYIATCSEKWSTGSPVWWCDGGCLWVVLALAKGDSERQHRITPPSKIATGVVGEDGGESGVGGWPWSYAPWVLPMVEAMLTPSPRSERGLWVNSWWCRDVWLSPSAHELIIVCRSRSRSMFAVKAPASNSLKGFQCE